MCNTPGTGVKWLNAEWGQGKTKVKSGGFGSWERAQLLDIHSIALLNEPEETSGGAVGATLQETGSAYVGCLP